MYLVELSRMDAVQALRQAVSELRAEITFHEISLWPMMSRICWDNDDPQKCGFYSIEILLYAALALVAYNSH